jgi:recombination protein RecA
VTRRKSAPPSKLTPRELAAQVNAVLGTGTITLGSAEQYRVRYLPTGLLPVDIGFNGGIPRGRHTECFGGPSMLKSFIGYRAIAQTQRDGGTAALIDTEHSYDEDWAAECGIDTDALITKWPTSGEQGLDIGEVLIRNRVDLLVVDSIASLLPKAERNRALSDKDPQLGRLAYLMSRALPKLTTANVDTALFWINQTRAQIGQLFGPHELTSGGRAMPFYASQRANIRGVGKVYRARKRYDGAGWVKSRDVIAQRYRLTMEKSKLTTPYREVTFEWDLSTGRINLDKFLFAMGVELGIISQPTKQSYRFGQLTVVGREKFVHRIVADRTLAQQLETSIRAHYDLPTTAAPARKTLRKLPSVDRG